MLTGETRQGHITRLQYWTLVDTDNDGMYEFVDPLSGQKTPYHFVSSNNGQGYSKTDGSLNFYVDGDGKTPLKRDSIRSFHLVSTVSSASTSGRPPLP
ncbi:MAG: hypothetical protein R3C19_19105 [Planctomycetaceae bacterium]